MTWPYSLALVAGVFIALFGLVWFRSRKATSGIPSPAWRFSLRLSLALTLASILTGGSVLAWYFGRPQPVALKQSLFTGIIYERETHTSPRPVVIHIVTIDLTRPGLSFLVTPGKPGEKHPLNARTTSDFAREFGAQLAINGDFFSPWFSKTPWNYYPRTGDPVTVHGFTSSRGTVYTEGERKWDAPTLYLSKDNRPSLQRPKEAVYNAISGNLFLVREGKADVYPRPDSNLPEPRTALGFNREANKLILILVDGRQLNYSEGVDVDELAELFVKHGAWSAMNLDGGGSTTLVTQVNPGVWRILNTPAHTRIPGRERPVANHLGIFLGKEK
jgi:hypothetical protein